jgi:hypothetical protein
VEHLVVILLLYTCVSLMNQKSSNEGCACTVGTPGPNTVFSNPDVQRAPEPSIDVQQLKVGEAISHTDVRGAIHRFKVC